MMWESFINGFFLSISWQSLGYMLLAIPIGLTIGAIPGLGGNLGLALLIPFTFGMEPLAAFALLLGMHSVVHTGSPIPSILFDTPGAGPAAATCLDGYPMAQKGEAGRALGATFASSGVGGVIGALAMAITIPVIRPIVLAFGPPEFFMLAMLGLAFIASVSGESIARGLIAGAVGLIISFVGMDPQTGVVRFGFGQLYLWEGIKLVPVVIGLFALAEVIDLGKKGTKSIAQVQAYEAKGGMWQGVKDTFIHWWLVLRCSIIGDIIGMIPGLGGDAASFIAYGHAQQTSKHPEEFGKGTVEGVLAPESANNSKEGGALIPTLAFGVPGSSGMAILLGAFMILGLAPGPEMLTKHLDLTFSMVWMLVIANVLAALACLATANHLAKITFIRSSILIPFILVFGLVGSYLTTNHMGDLIITLLMGFLGYGMKKYDYPRASLILGLILGEIAENNLHLSLNLFGPAFLLRPMTLIILAIAALPIVFPWFKKAGKKEGKEGVR